MVRHAKSTVWQNFPLPDELARDESFLIELKGQFVGQASTDMPSSSDLARIVGQYNAASLSEREAMNNVFVWALGYTLPRLAAGVAAGESAGSDAADAVYERWRSEGKGR